MGFVNSLGLCVHPECGVNSLHATLYLHDTLYSFFCLPVKFCFLLCLLLTLQMLEQDIEKQARKEVDDAIAQAKVNFLLQ